MECKSINTELGRIAKEVLIETLWNVNKANPYKYSLADSVLIETLWNVNNYTATELTKGT